MVRKIDPRIKDAFLKIKLDMNGLYQGMVELKDEVKELRSEVHSGVRSEPIPLVRSEVHSGVRSEPNHSKLVGREKMIKKYTKGLGSAIKTYIIELSTKGYTTKQMEELICDKEKVCGKTTFYKHLSLLRSELRSGVRSEVVK